MPFLGVSVLWRDDDWSRSAICKIRSKLHGTRRFGAGVRLRYFAVRNLYFQRRTSRFDDMKRYIWIHISLFVAVVGACVLAHGTRVEQQKRQPKTVAQTIVFLGDTLRLQLPNALLGRLEKCDADHYKQLRNNMLRANYAPLIAQLDAYCTSRRACDWCRYLLVRAVSEGALPDTMSDERIALQIFLLERMGFDARAAQQGERLVMLLPFDDTIYERGYIHIGEQRFYIFEYDSAPEGYVPIAPPDTSPRRPLSIEIGAGFDSPHTTTIALPLWSRYLGEAVAVPISRARIELMRQYPTTEKAPFHRAEIPAALCDTLLPILARHIAQMSQLDAAQFLLGLVQHGFEFTSDSDLFGRHKQMTVEESLYYGRNNCKDRTLIYSWLVDKLLGLQTVLVDYQIDTRIESVGHVACGVEFSDNVAGVFITHRGRRFTICDPSYIDAPVGYPMPRYARWPMKVLEL